MFISLRSAASATLLALFAVFTGSTIAFAQNADTTAPTVSAITPTSVALNVATTMSATYSDDVGVTSCHFYTGLIDRGEMALTSGKATISYTFTTTTTTYVSAKCYDAAGNVGTGSSTAITVSADTTAPTVSAITPTTASTNVAQTYAITYSDAIGVTRCDFYVGAIDYGDFTIANGSGTFSYTFTTSGSKYVTAKCVDASGNTGSGSQTTITVTTDSTAPTVSSVSPTTATIGTAVTVSATYSDAIGVTSCNFYTGAIDRGAMTLGSSATSGTATLSYTFTSATTTYVSVKCKDASGNTGTGASTAVAVSASQSSDTTAPTVGALTPTTATVGIATTVSASYSDAVGVTGCTLYMDGNVQGAMILGNGTATLTLTPEQALTVSGYATCVDAAGNVGTGTTTTIVISAAQSSDSTAPTVSSVSPTTATVGTAVTVSATYSDAIGVTSCNFYTGAIDRGAMTLGSSATSGTATLSYTFTSATTTYVSVKCKDAAGNLGTGATTAISISSSSSADTTAPTVGALSPTTATVGTAVTITTTYSDAVGVTGCTLYIDGNNQGAMTLNNGTASLTLTPASASTTTGYAKCTDAAGNVGTGTTTTLVVSASSTAVSDTTKPTVGSVSPTTATAGSPVTLSVTYSDAVGVAGCVLYIDGKSQGAMAMGGASTSGTATMTLTPGSAGTFALQATCTDAAGNVGTGTSVNATVSAASTTTSSDTTAPTVTAPTPTTATVGVTTTLSVTYSDAVGVSTCSLYIDNNFAGVMALNVGTASTSGAFDTAGNHSAYAACKDAAGNVGTSATSTIVVAAASTDTTAPTISTVTPTTATQNSAASFVVTATDASGIYNCHLFINAVDQGVMIAGSSDTYSRSYTPATSSSFTAYAQCGDAVGNLGVGASVTVTVTAAAVTATDSTAPTVSAISPTSVVAGEWTVLQASVEDSGGMGTCVLYVNSTLQGSMTVANGYATYLYMFSDSGTAIANAYCVDAAGNATRGASSTITVDEAQEDETDSAVSEADAGALLKLACDSDADVSDPCRAVYYYDGIGRHAFPNEKVFFTWFDSFDSIVIVTEDFMSSITLDHNITYHPGATMVKFVSLNTVYVVGEEGELRAIDSEETAAALYGDEWNQHIHDISDAFYSNYTFGDPLTDADEFDPDTVKDGVTSIDQIL